jgi:para-nitrobenzyl esterase
VYRYHFELAATPSKFHPGTFAFHSDDIEYVFGTLDTRPAWKVSPEDRTLSDQVMTYWTNFAKTGDPNGAGMTVWPKYNDDGYPLIHLNAPVTAGPDALRPRYLFLQEGMPSMRMQ